MIEKLKNVVLDELSVEQIDEHKSAILEMEETEIVEYLKYAIDTFYKTEDDGDNAKSVDLFFDNKEFKPYYDLILNSDEAEDTVEEEK